MHLFFHIQNLQLLSFMSSSLIWPKLNIFVLFYYIVTSNFFFSFLHFLHIRSLLVLLAYISIEPIGCILLSSFELKAILLISSVKTLCFSILNLCCVFVISLVFFYEFFLIFFKTIYINFIFFLNGFFYFQFELLLNSFDSIEI